MSRCCGAADPRIFQVARAASGRALLADDLLRVSADQRERPYIGAMLAPGNRPLYVDSPTLRVISGPHHANAAQLSVLIATPYQLTSQSNRMGYRLEGQRLHEDPRIVGSRMERRWTLKFHRMDLDSVDGGPANDRRVSQDRDGHFCRSASGRTTPTRRHRDLSHDHPGRGRVGIDEPMASHQRYCHLEIAKHLPA